MHWVVFVIAALVGILFGRNKFGYAISTVLFIVFWLLLFKTGYSVVHMSTVYVGKENPFGQEIGNIVMVGGSSLMFAGFFAIFPNIFGFVLKPLGKLLEPVTDKIYSIAGPVWNNYNKKDKGIEYVKKLDNVEKLKFIAGNTLVEEVAIEAVKKIEDENFIYTLARSVNKPLELRKLCVDKIDDKDRLNSLLNLRNNVAPLIEKEFKEYVKKKLK